MKTKRTKKLLAFIIATAMAVLLMGTVVSAASNYTPVPGTSTSFTKYLVIPSDMGVPTLSFNFTIRAGEAVPGDSDTDILPIYAGSDDTKVIGAPSIAANQASFSSADGTTRGESGDGIANMSTKKYAQKAVTVDFTGVQFKEPGVYRWVIEEVQENNGAAIDTTPRTLDVNVQDQNGSLVVAGYTMYYGEIHEAQPVNPDDRLTPKHGADADITDGDKCDSFVNSYPSHNLYVGKKIEGNQASKDKYFRFIVSFTDAPAGTVLSVDRSNCTTEISTTVNGATIIDTDDISAGATSYTNPSSITIGTDGTAEAVFYLQGDQYINIMGLPKNAHYSVVEDEAAKEDGYTITAADSTNFTIGSGDSAVTFSNPTSGPVQDVDIMTGYKNYKNGTIPTGVILSVAGLLVVGIFAVIGFVFFGLRSKRRYDED